MKRAGFYRLGGFTLVGLSLFLGGCGEEGGGGFGVGVVASIGVTPANPAPLQIGQGIQFSAVALDAQGRPVEVRFEWRVEGHIGTVSPNGFFVATAVGTGQVKATAQGQTGTAQVTVGAAIASILVSPSPQVVDVGATQPFTAAALDAHNRPVSATFTWSVTGGIGTVDQNGLFTATTPGSGTVVAAAGGKMGSAQVTVPFEVSPNGDNNLAGVPVKDQARAVAAQSLAVGDGTLSDHQLLAAYAVLEKLGESVPPGGGLSSRLRVGGFLSLARLVRLSQPSRLRARAAVDATVDGIHFTGSSTQSGSLVTVNVTGTAEGTNLTIRDTYSTDPDNFTRQLSLTGTLKVDGVSLSYLVNVNLNAQGHGSGIFDVRGSGTDQRGYSASLTLNGPSWAGREAVTRSDGFWTMTDFSAVFDGLGALESGDFSFRASNDYTGAFALHQDGTGSGQVMDSQGTKVADLSVNAEGDLVIAYVSGGSDVIAW